MREKSSFTLSRRDFLRQSGLSAVALPLLNEADLSPAISVGQPDSLSPAREGTVAVLCGMCRQSCPLLVRLDWQGKLDIRGNPNSPLHGGKLCSRALAAASLLDDPDRLRYPLKRTGKRGAGIWQRISWQEALDTVGSKLQEGIRQNGPESMGLFCGRTSSRFMVALCRQLGIENNVSASDNFCSSDSEGYPVVGARSGREMTAIVPKTPSNVGLFFGCHLGENLNIAMLRDVLSLKKRGGRIIVCDPRFSVLAGKADYHLMLRPGSDAMVIFCWLRTILDQHLQQGPMEALQPGVLVELRRTLEPFSPACVARLTDIDETLLTETARLLAADDSRVELYQGRFTAWHGNDSQRLFAMKLLALVLDSLYLSPPVLEESLAHISQLMTNSAPAEQEGKSERKVSGNRLLSKMLAGEVRTVGVWGSNPFHCYPNPYRTAAAFKKASFIFCTDLYPTESALYADIILPEASFLESQKSFACWRDGEGNRIVAAGFSALQPKFECRDAGWIVAQLGRQFGSSLFDGQGILLQDKVFLAGLGLAPDAFDQTRGIIVIPGAGSNGRKPAGQGHQPPGEQTGDHAADPASQEGEAAGQQDAAESSAPSFTLPPLSEVPLPPPGFARFFSGRLPVHTGSSTQNNGWLEAEIGENELWINEQTASRMGLQAGQQVHLVNQDGIRSITPIRLKTTPGIRSDCVYTPHGFGCFSPYMKRSFGRGLSDGALLTRGRVDPATGRPGLRCNFVKLISNGVILFFPGPKGADAAAPLPLLFQNDVRTSRG